MSAVELPPRPQKFSPLALEVSSPANWGPLIALGEVTAVSWTPAGVVITAAAEFTPDGVVITSVSYAPDGTVITATRFDKS
jgi:hypothetical protein